MLNYQKNNFCRLHVELLSSYGKEVYNFKFSLLSLVETNHFIYKYEGGIVDYRTAEDKELTELMAEYKDEHVISNELQLINKETVLGHKNIDINKNFEFYLNLFPNDAVLKCR